MILYSSRVSPSVRESENYEKPRSPNITTAIITANLHLLNIGSRRGKHKTTKLANQQRHDDYYMLN